LVVLDGGIGTGEEVVALFCQGHGPSDVSPSVQDRDVGLDQTDDDRQCSAERFGPLSPEQLQSRVVSRQGGLGCVWWQDSLLGGLGEQCVVATGRVQTADRPALAPGLRSGDRQVRDRAAPAETAPAQQVAGHLRNTDGASDEDGEDLAPAAVPPVLFQGKGADVGVDTDRDVDGITEQVEQFRHPPLVRAGPRQARRVRPAAAGRDADADHPAGGGSERFLRQRQCRTNHCIEAPFSVGD